MVKIAWLFTGALALTKPGASCDAEDGSCSSDTSLLQLQRVKERQRQELDLEELVREELDCFRKPGGCGFRKKKDKPKTKVQCAAGWDQQGSWDTENDIEKGKKVKRAKTSDKCAIQCKGEKTCKSYTFALEGRRKKTCLLHMSDQHTGSKGSNQVLCVKPTFQESTTVAPTTPTPAPTTATPRKVRRRRRKNRKPKKGGKDKKTTTVAPTTPTPAPTTATPTTVTTAAPTIPQVGAAIVSSGQTPNKRQRPSQPTTTVQHKRLSPEDQEKQEKDAEKEGKNSKCRWTRQAAMKADCTNKDMFEFNGSVGAAYTDPTYPPEEYGDDAGDAGWRTFDSNEPKEGWHVDGRKDCVAYAGTNGKTCSRWCQETQGMKCVRGMDDAHHQTRQLSRWLAKGGYHLTVKTETKTQGGCTILPKGHNRKSQKNNGCEQGWGTQICACVKDDTTTTMATTTTVATTTTRKVRRRRRKNRKPKKGGKDKKNKDKENKKNKKPKKGGKDTKKKDQKNKKNRKATVVAEATPTAPAVGAAVVTAADAAPAPPPRTRGEASTETTTTEVGTPECKICTLKGDPHIETFDRGTKNKKLNFYNYGDYWIVKNENVYIQGLLVNTTRRSVCHSFFGHW